MEIKEFKNTLIAFDFDREMINATDMIKAYPNKRVNDYLRLKSAKEYKEHLETETGNPVLVVKHGGKGHGTWMSQKLALDFASWLDVKFRDFIYETFLNTLKEKLKSQQRELDYFWDKEDIKDNYR